MNLLCPNCQKMLQVPEQYAGQMMKCPLCAGTFTVPALPQAPAAPPPPPPAPSVTVPDKAAAPAPSAAQKTTAPAAPSGYAHTRTYTLNPRKLGWVAPVALAIVFILLFLPWIGMYPNGNSAVTQSGWGAAFGSAAIDDVWKANNKDMLDYLTKDGPGSSVALILFVLVFLVGLIVGVGGLLLHLKIIPVALPPSVEPYWSFRPLAVAGLSLLALVFLLLQVFSNFPLEEMSMKKAKELAASGPGARENQQDTPEKKQVFQLDVGKMYGQFSIERTSVVGLTVLLMIVAVLGALVEWLVTRRGEQPVPRLDLHY